MQRPRCRRDQSSHAPVDECANRVDGGKENHRKPGPADEVYEHKDKI